MYRRLSIKHHPDENINDHRVTDTQMNLPIEIN